jgi:putative Mn2+ efflux pump MntP
MDINQALTFAIAVSISSMLIIAGAAFLGAYRFLKNIGIFKGHYYY